MSLTPTGLRCEGIPGEPLGIDLPNPTLSWRLTGGGRGVRQTAYQLQVASSPKSLHAEKALVWDSGRLPTEARSAAYAGRALRPFERLFWRVRVWDESEKASAWSTPAAWTMGALAPTDWANAQWISAADLLSYTPPTGKPNAPQEKWETLLLHRSFAVRPGLVRALALVSGLGHYEMSVNGTRLGGLLAPGWTHYAHTVLYGTYDLTAHLKAGENATGLLLGNGFYNVHGGRYTKFVGAFAPLRAICLLRLEYKDGTIETIGTDTAWHLTPGPITFSCMYGGEDWDARREPQNWSRPGFDTSDWEPAALAPEPGGRLSGIAYASPPFRTHETLKPAKITPVPAAPHETALYDLGQNASLMPHLRVSGPAGSIVRITPSEVLTPEGALDRRSVGGRQAWWQYTLKGNGDETYFPRFFYHGSRYLQVERLPATEGGKLPEIKELTGVVVHSDCPPVGEFSCSHDLLNRIHTLIRWAQRSNLAHVITDCPHRERLGWLEQYHLHGPSLRYNFDLSRLYRKCFEDMAEAQQPNGLVPDIAPEYVVFNAGFRDSPEWGSAFLLSAWQQYEWTGETAFLARYFDGMKRYVDYLESTATDHIVSHGLGDWYDIGPNPPGYAQLTPMALTATGHYYKCVQSLARMATLLGRSADAVALGAQAAAIRDAFNQKFLNPGAPTGYSTGSQCANALPLACGLVPEEEKARVLAALVADIQNRGNAITTGDIGHRYLLRALADSGRSDVIFALHGTPSDKPSYALQLARGCTSLAESWDADPRWSQNHFMLGHITEWLYADLAGIAPAPESAGWASVLLRPQPVKGVEWAKARYESPRGPISVEWHTSGDQFKMDISLPPGVRARLDLPARDRKSVTESGRPVTEGPGLAFRETSPAGRVYFALLSGDWKFASRR